MPCQHEQPAPLLLSSEHCSDSICLPCAIYLVAACLCVQAGITCVGASRLLAGDSSGEAAADSLRQGTAWPLSLAGWLDSAKLQQGAGDAKMAAIGMVLILLSQVKQ